MKESLPPSACTVCPPPPGRVQCGSHIICMGDGGEVPLHLEGSTGVGTCKRFSWSRFLMARVNMSPTVDPRSSGHLQFSLMEGEKSLGHIEQPRRCLCSPAVSW